MATHRNNFKAWFNISNNTTRFLLVSVIMILHTSTVSAQDGWACTVDKSLGYNYDYKHKTWQAANFYYGINFIVRPPHEEDTKVFPDAFSQAYVVLQLNEPVNIYITTCPFIPDTDGLMICQRVRELQIFSINTRQLRMEIYYSGNYLVGQEDPNSPVAAGSSLAIGRCHPL
jgi:hypothetical protein